MNGEPDNRPAHPAGDAGRVPWLFRRATDLADEDRRGVLEDLFFEGPEWRPYIRRHFSLMALSTTIALFGLINDSGAVVIGAMLVAPLMTPIMAFAAATVMAWPRRQLRTALIVAASAAFAVALSWAWELAIRGNELEITDELMARTAPNLLDLGIAVFAGAAGAYVSVRRRALGALPGVAIAVALVPPLATVGAMIARGEGGLARGALLLFATNLAAIVLAAGLVLVFTGFVPRAEALRAHRSARAGLALAVVAVAAVAVPLARHTHAEVHEANTRAEVTEGVEAWLGDRGLAIDEIEIDERTAGDRWTLLVRLIGVDQPPPGEALARAVAERVGRPGTVTVQWLPAEVRRADAAPGGPPAR